MPLQVTGTYIIPYLLFCPVSLTFLLSHEGFKAEITGLKTSAA